MKLPMPFPPTIKCSATNIIPITINIIPYNTFSTVYLISSEHSSPIYLSDKFFYQSVYFIRLICIGIMTGIFIHLSGKPSSDAISYYIFLLNPLYPFLHR